MKSIERIEKFLDDSPEKPEKREFKVNEISFNYLPTRCTVKNLLILV